MSALSAVRQVPQGPVVGQRMQSTSLTRRRRPRARERRIFSHFFANDEVTAVQTCILAVTGRAGPGRT